MLLAILLQRCPRCRKGKAFRGFLSMHELCPVCGWRFERDPGYFTGAMYGSYGLGLVLVTPVCLWMLYAGASLEAILLTTGLILAVTFPLMFRYSRVLWMHWDVFFNGTGEGPAGSIVRAGRRR